MPDSSDDRSRKSSVTVPKENDESADDKRGSVETPNIPTPAPTTASQITPPAANTVTLQTISPDDEASPLIISPEDEASPLIISPADEASPLIISPADKAPPLIISPEDNAPPQGSSSSEIAPQITSPAMHLPPRAASAASLQSSQHSDSKSSNKVVTEVPENNISALPVASKMSASTTSLPPTTANGNQEVVVSPLEMEIIDAIEKRAAKDAAEAEAAKQQAVKSKYITEKGPLITEIKRYYPVIVEVKPKKQEKKKKKKGKDMKKVHPDAAAVEEIHARAKEKWRKVGEHLHDIETGLEDTDDEIPVTGRTTNRSTMMQLSNAQGGSALTKLRSPQNIGRKPSKIDLATINLLFRKVPRSIDKLSVYLPAYNDDVLESVSEIIFKPYPWPLQMFAYLLLILQLLSLMALVVSLSECPEEKIGWSIMAGIPLCCGYAGIESVHQMLRYCHLGSPHRWKVILIAINGILQMIAVGAVMGKSTNMLDLISNFIGVAIVLQIDELLAGYLRIKDIDRKLLAEKSWRSKMLLSSKLWLVGICGMLVYGVTQFFWQYDKTYCSSQYADA